MVFLLVSTKQPHQWRAASSCILLHCLESISEPQPTPSWQYTMMLSCHQPSQDVPAFCVCFLNLPTWLFSHKLHGIIIFLKKLSFYLPMGEQVFRDCSVNRIQVKISDSEQAIIFSYSMTHIWISRVQTKVNYSEAFTRSNI